ncbi:MAG: DUF3149 domain-containing protein [Oleibacter sp.]|nr:DUF3149 domain-containing protein [Thalassolituus sp.]
MQPIIIELLASLAVIGATLGIMGYIYWLFYKKMMIAEKSNPKD